MTENGTADQAAAAGTSDQAERGAGDPAVQAGTDPLGGGPDWENREQVSVTVDPEMPYVGGQSDPYAEKRNSAGQLSPEDGAAPAPG